MDTQTVIEDLKKEVQIFCDERDWGQFHGVKDLSIGLITEASELLELFRFKSEQECEALVSSTDRQKVEDELSDVLFFILRFAQKYNVDLTTALNRKMQKNRAKYPIDKARGSNKKYSEL